MKHPKFYIRRIPNFANLGNINLCLTEFRGFLTWNHLAELLHLVAIDLRIETIRPHQYNF